MYELYKPFRNYVRQLSLLESLGVIRAYIQHLQFGQPFPEDVEVHQHFRTAPRPERGVYEWELEILAKELILHAPDNGVGDLRTWNNLAEALNRIKKLEDDISGHYRDLIATNILLELFRIAHRQFPWQRRIDTSVLTRYLKIFGRPEMEPILAQQVGLDARTLYTVGLAMSGIFLERFALDFPPRIDIPGITPEHVQRFVDRFSVDLAGLRRRIADAQSYDEDYAYALNPLKVTPLIHVTLRGRPTLIAPVTPYLLQRFTEGVYYEIYDAPGFAAAFGTAFQDYVGEVISAANRGGEFRILGEQPYRVGRDVKQSVDWIVSDRTAELFIECKTKRIRFASKIALASTEELDNDLAKMAGFVVQAYKTLEDAKAGAYSHWKPAELPIYPVVLTLEEWYAFGDRILPAIDERVRAGLARVGLSEAMLAEHPYMICSVDDFEKAIQVMRQVGIARVLATKTQGERRLWAMHPMLLESFHPELQGIQRNLFPDHLERIYPERRA